MTEATATPTGKHQYNPSAEIPEAALNQARQDWQNRSPADMAGEQARLRAEIRQIHAHQTQGGEGANYLDSPVLGGPGASAEDRMQAMTQRMAVLHYLTDTLSRQAAQQAQMDAIVHNMANGIPGMPADAVEIPDRELALEQQGQFGRFLHGLNIDVADLQDYYSSPGESPIVQALLGRQPTIQMALSERVQHLSTTSAGVTAERAPDRRRVDLEIRNPELLDFVGMEREERGVYTWIKETMLSGADGQADVAAEKAENAASTAEALFVDSREETNIPLVEVHTTATYEQLSNTMRARRIIEEKLPQMIDRVIDKKALMDLARLTGIGTQTGTNVTGGTDGSLETLNAADLILRAMIEQVFATGRTDANLAVLTPKFYTRFLTEQSSSGGYLIRSSSELSPVRTAWGLPVALVTFESNANAADFQYGYAGHTMGVVGDFMNYAVLAYAEESMYRILDQDGTDALKLAYKFQAWWRAIVIYFRAKAFCRLVQGPVP